MSFIIGVCLLLPAISAVPTLINANVVFRHGDRTPLNTVRTDPYQENFWGLPWGTLTKTGMSQQFVSGKKLADRYIRQFGLVNATYHATEILVRSAVTDRCIVSAMANMAGFYQNSNFHPQDLKWPTNWTPVPVHPPETLQDYLYDPDRKCPREEELFAERTTHLNFLEYELEHASLLLMFAKNTGEAVSHIINIFDYADTLVCEKDHNLTLPAWVTSEIYAEIEEVKAESLDYLVGLGGFGVPDDIQLLKLRGGQLLKEVISTLTENSTFKYYVHSAHDKTIVSLLNTLGTNAKYSVLGSSQPDYAAALAIELWRLDDGSLGVQALYAPNAQAGLTPFTSSISGCPNSDFCPLQEFLARSKEYIPDDIVQDCHINGD